MDSLSAFSITAANFSPINIAKETLQTKVAAKLSAGKLTIEWSSGGVLQESSNLVNWDDVVNAVSPFKVTPVNPKKFYKVRP